MNKRKRIIGVLLINMLMVSMMPSLFVPAFAQSESVGVIQVSCGWNHTGILKTDGSLWMTGSNYYGQFGDGTKEGKTTPVKVMDDVAQVTCGESYTGILKTDGSLWMTGTNDCGQLGNGTTGRNRSPEKIAENVAQVSCGSWHTGILKTDGSLWMTGLNGEGQLGNGTTEEKHSPVKIMDDVAQVSCGGFHTGILKTDGSLWMTGYNSNGQLGDGSDGSTEYKVSPVKIMDDVAQVSCGIYYTGILKTDGSLWMTGSNYYGQFGDGTTDSKNSPVKIMDNVAHVSCGRYHTGILKTDGSLWVAGENSSGQLGDGTTRNKSSPKKIMDSVTQISCGGHTGILKTDGSLWVAGDNSSGQLGDGTTENKSTPVNIFIGGGEPEEPDENRRFKFYKTKKSYLKQSGLWPKAGLGSAQDYLLLTRLEENMNESLSGPIPGIIKTTLSNGSACKSSEEYVPQGLCRFGDYYIVTAYEYTETLPSVLYILDHSWNLITTVTIGDYSFHNGGIAYDPDGDVLWFCGNTGGKKKYKGYKGPYFVYRLKGSALRDAISTGEKYVHLDSFSKTAGKYGVNNDEYAVLVNDSDNKTSCLDYFDGRLWVGTCSSTLPLIVGYKTSGLEFDSEDRVVIRDIEKNLNGFTFENSKSLYASYSGGRSYEKEARIARYDITDPLAKGKLVHLKEAAVVDLPKMNEEILLDNGTMYINFESGANEYCKNAYNKTDRIIALPSSLWHSGSKMKTAGMKTASTDAETWDGSAKGISFSFDPANSVYDSVKFFDFTPNQTGMYKTVIYNTQDDNGKKLFVTAEVTDDDNYYGCADTDGKDSGECSVLLTKGKTYRVTISAVEEQQFSQAAYDAGDSEPPFSGSCDISMHLTGSAEAASKHVSAGAENTIEVSEGDSGCFLFVPEETGSYSVDWSADGDLGDILILEDMQKVVAFKGDFCELTAGKKYYFISHISEMDDTGSKGTISLAVNKLEDKAYDSDGVSGVPEGAFVDYTAAESGMHIIRVTRGSIGNMMVYDEEGSLLAFGEKDVTFTAGKNEKYKIMCSGCSGDASLKVELYKPGEQQSPDPEDPSENTGEQKPGDPTDTSGGSGASASPEQTVPAADSAPANVSSVADLPSVKILKPATGTKSANIKWQAVSKKNLKKTKKIQIQYSMDKKFRKGVKTKYASAKKTSYKIKGLKSKKKYYVRIRAYTKKGKTVHVSKWSKVKSVKIK